MNSTTIQPDPLWYKDAIIYEVHVRAFFDANNDGIGDFPGLTQKLDYLQDLGITCIWLLPFYPSPLRDDGYDIANYRGIHPSYGTRRDFKVFLREAHRRGMRVITELVINHTSDQHPWFQAARQAPKGSEKRSYYVWSDTEEKYKDARIIFTDTETSNWTWDPVAKQYYWHRFFHHQPDLNFDNPHVFRAVTKIMHFWFDMGVDGVRLDAIPYLIERDGTNCENLAETHVVLKNLRRELDAKYHDKMFLAEANQWPDDVRPYFGDGDECHMAYHFPVMPRIFMGLRQEDRQPIIDILDRTPEIPENCQWAMFLRNHDELTLEMVTNEERDYMYKEYAADPQARINLGIRRRLAPLVNYSRRRLELLTSLLFSFPGTPVMYYGDEIGMGDNIYLGDRNGVRTPMQWTGDRNAGFSKADFARLYAAPIMDPVSGYQAINVEAQQRDPSSLLNWTKRMIDLRKQHQTFGRGSIEFLHPANRKVLAYIRKHENDIILCVANLSRFVQPAELDMAEYNGMTPIEMVGRTEFPKIGELPYFVTLGPHTFYWFQLQKAAEPIMVQLAPTAPPELTEAIPTLQVEGGYETLLDAANRRRLEADVLPEYLPKQRWFSAKARTIQSVSVLDASEHGLFERHARFTILEVQYTDGTSQIYDLPIAVATGPGAEILARENPKLVLCQLVGAEQEASSPGRERDEFAILHDAIADEMFCQAMLSAVAKSSEWSSSHGMFKAEPTVAFAELRGQADETLEVRRGSVEQSNTSLRYGDRIFMKLFRRLEPGLNPEIEIGRFLTERTHFDRIPRTAGSIEYQPPGSEPISMAVLQEMVTSQADGWQHALEELSRYYEVVSSLPEESLPTASNGHSPLELVRQEPSALVQETVGAYLAAAATLGQRTAELHLALASDPNEPSFAPEPIRPEDQQTLAAAIRQQVDSALDTLKRRFDTLPKDVTPDAQRVLEGAELLTKPLEELPGATINADKIRVHGDYHLGQVLWSMNDYILLDFEGEPAKSLELRRAKHSPIKDVVGMLRSYDYASYAALFSFTQDRPEDFPKLAPWARLWHAWTSAAYLRAYLATAGEASFLPRSIATQSLLLRAYLLDKALYELQYELNNRPDWVRIPLQAVLQLIEQGRANEPSRSSSPPLPEAKNT